METDELIRGFDSRLAELGVSDDYRELLVSNVRQNKSLAGMANAITEVLNEIEDKLSRAALKESFPEIDENVW